MGRTFAFEIWGLFRGGGGGGGGLPLGERDLLSEFYGIQLYMHKIN